MSLLPHSEMFFVCKMGGELIEIIIILSVDHKLQNGTFDWLWPPREYCGWFLCKTLFYNINHQVFCYKNDCKYDEGWSNTVACMPTISQWVPSDADIICHFSLLRHFFLLIYDNWLPARRNLRHVGPNGYCGFINFHLFV